MNVAGHSGKDGGREDGAGGLVLEGELTIQGAAELKALLLAGLAKTGRLTVDLSAVTAIDLAAIQLLTAAARSAEARGGRLAIVDRTAAVVRPVLEAAGMLAGEPAAADPWAGAYPWAEDWR
jgi:anti-anti-sigma factor